MDEDFAMDILNKAGYSVKSIKRIPEGASHYVFQVVTSDESLIVKFEKEQIKTSDGIRRDFQYNSILSFERQAYLCSLVREKAGLPAPHIKKIYRDKNTSFLAVEEMPGLIWADYLKQKNYSLDSYLDSLYYLGGDIAQAQRLCFESYGNIMDAGKISPPRILNFASRLEEINKNIIFREIEKKSLSPRNLQRVINYLQNKTQEINSKIESKNKYFDFPIFVFGDFHPRNHLVDEKGKVTGYFDLELCQAGHPEQEFQILSLQLWNYFNEDTFRLAKEKFFSGFNDNGGKYNLNNPINKKIGHLLSIGKLLIATTAYFGVKDGLRDTWSERFKELLFSGINTGFINYDFFGDIIREKTGQPKFPIINSNS